MVNISVIIIDSNDFVGSCWNIQDCAAKRNKFQLGMQKHRLQETIK